MESNYDAFYCPITGELMQDPVILPDGFSYERNAIEDWLQEHKKSPFTGQAFSANDLVPNRALKEQIESIPKNELKPKINSKFMKQNEELQGVTPKELNLDASVDSQGFVKISIGIPDIEECPPVDIICVVDISGSMEASCAGVTDGRTQYIELGFSLMDLVKHAVRTVIKTLRPQDRLTIVQFDNVAKICFGPSKMTEASQQEAFNAVNNLVGKYQTNIYNALIESLKLIEKRSDKSRNPAILFFTDGQPNVSPAGGEVKCLQQYANEKQITCPIHTYGFGQYDRLNSALLYDIAKMFHGMNGYIPDPTNIGTIFVNALSNILTTAAIDVKYHINVQQLGKNLKKVHIGDLHSERDQNGFLIVEIGSVRFGQTIDILLQLDPESVDKQNFTANYLSYESNGKQLQAEGKTELLDVDSNEILSHLLRFETIEIFQYILKNYKQHFEQCQNQLKQHISKWKQMQLVDKVSQGIIKNLEDQITTALQKQKYLEKWGNHQLRQLIRSLNLQAKGNFRDPAVANFGGKLFNTFADIADNIYNNLPPPKPSLANQQQQTPQQNQQQNKQVKQKQQVQAPPPPPVPQTPQDFADIYNNVNCGAGCFSGDCVIKMQDGTIKSIDSLKKGDLVSTPNGAAQILCVLKIKVNGYLKMCNFRDGLKITPRHPIQIAGEWKYPSDLQKVEMCHCDYIYNLIVDRDYIVTINGINVICLGHQYQTGILKHEYLGSTEVIRDLEKMPGWQSGSIQLKSGCFIKQNGTRSKVIYNGN